MQIIQIHWRHLALTWVKLYVKDLISLSKAQIESGVICGRMRDKASKSLGQAQARGLDGRESLETHIQGALGEIAAAQFLGVDYAYSCNAWNEPDLISRKGSRVDVKTSPARNSGLMVSPAHIHDEWIYLAVTQLSSGEYRVNGWMTGKEIRTYPLYSGNGRKPAHLARYNDLDRFN